MRKLGLLLFFTLLFCVDGFSTHNRAGEITYKHISGLTYEFTVTIFADPNSPAISRKEIEINWGDNTKADSLIVSPNTVDVVPGSVVKRFWTSRHTFPGPGSYRVSVTDLNRNGGVDNISNSSSVPFYIESLLRISPIGNFFNNSVELRNDPIDDACVGQTFVHNPGAVDQDGDSLAYSISPSYGLNGDVAPGYFFPPASTSISVNPQTGDLVWQNPTQAGLYNIAILIKEYRNGILLGEVLRDLQIVVYVGCNNTPPTISVNRNYCVEAEKALLIPVNAFDQDLGDKVRLEFTGEIFENFIPNRATFSTGPISNPTSGNVFWSTICDNVRENPYSLSIKATDDGGQDGRGDLSTFENSSIQVIGPAPKNVLAQSQRENINLTWDQSICNNAVAYKIYRRIDSSGFLPDSCEIGVPSSLGFQMIKRINDLSLTHYLDDNDGRGLVPGQKYCYLITAIFSGNIEGYASNESCSIVEKFVPVMTKVSVDSTAVFSGEIKLSWSQPDTIDAQAFPPPYRYLVYKRNQDDTRELLDSTEGLANDSLLISAINTLNTQFEYQVELKSAANNQSRSMGFSSPAKSIFLSQVAKDNAVELSWNVSVPWTNHNYQIFRKAPTASSFVFLANTNTATYLDQGLSNGNQYCYLVQSSGSYSIASVDSPLINRSQIICAVPEDIEPPCAPILTVMGDCDLDQLNLNWEIIDQSCGAVSEVTDYQIYRSETIDGVFNSQAQTKDTFYIKMANTIAGCYAVSAIDSSGNESKLSNRVCIDYCPSYELPNIFTPNGDGINDLLVPVMNPGFKYVDSVDMKIFNRWGEMVFETNDPEINWTGKYLGTKDLVSNGVYFYTCLVFENNLTGLTRRILKGTVNVQDGRPNKLE